MVEENHKRFGGSDSDENPRRLEFIHVKKQGFMGGDATFEMLREAKERRTNYWSVKSEKPVGSDENATTTTTTTTTTTVPADSPKVAFEFHTGGDDYAFF